MNGKKRSLHIAQPSLSKQLMELEKKLGKQLLVRGKRKITLTEEGVLLRKRAEEILELVAKTQQDIKRIPLIMHQRIGLQSEIAHWAGLDIEDLHIAATYNVVHGSPVPFVQQGIGYFLTTRDLLGPVLDPDVCFLPLNPQFPTRLALVWKKHTLFSKAADIFLNQFILTNYDK